MRARLGFESGNVAGTALLVEGEFVRPIVEDYNSTINGNTVYPVVADPRSSELNRLQMTNSSLPLTTVTLGRQRIVLDDHRFVGDVGWRQNEQTFDAIRIVNKSVPHLTLDLTYLDQVNRVFGRDSAQGRYYGDSVLANASYEMTPGKLTAFAYRIAIEPLAGVPGAVRDASQTFGVRSRVRIRWGREAVVRRVVRHSARRQPAIPCRSTSTTTSARSMRPTDAYSLGAGVEILEGDGSKGFTTPLATLHKFQGWADKFLDDAGGWHRRSLSDCGNLAAALGSDGHVCHRRQLSPLCRRAWLDALWIGSGSAGASEMAASDGHSQVRRLSCRQPADRHDEVVVAGGVRLVAVPVIYVEHRDLSRLSSRRMDVTLSP